MSAMPKQDWTSEADYLKRDAASDVKLEYFAGEVRTMVGAKRRHNIIVSRLIGLFDRALLERPCEYYPGDMRVHVATDLSAYYYPDLSVICGEPRLVEEVFDTLINPQVIVEVLSPSTRDYDTGEKLENYKKIPSLQHYVLVEQDRPRIQLYTRHTDGAWLYYDLHGLESSLNLTAVDCTFTLAEIYAKVSFDDPATPTENDTATDDKGAAE